MWSAPLCPTRSSLAPAGTRTSCGCRRPGRARCTVVPQRVHGRPVAPVDVREARLGARRAAELRIRGAGGAQDGARPRRRRRSPARPPRVDLRVEAALALPEVPDAGDRALVEQRVADRRAWGRRRAAGAATTSSSKLLADDVRAQPRDAPVEAGARLGHQLEHRSVELHHLALGRCGARARRGAACARQRSSAAVRRPTRRHAQVRVQRRGRPRSAGTGACRGRRRRRPRGRRAARASGRGEAGCGVSSSSGTWPTSTRPDPVGGVVDRVALGHGYLGYAACESSR